MTVTLETLKEYGFFFSYPTQGDEKKRMEQVINDAEADYLDAILSPELADVFNNDPSNEIFEDLRGGWITDEHIRSKGLDYALNYRCAVAIIDNCSFAFVNKSFQISTSKNEKRMNGSSVTNSWYNESSSIGDLCTDYVESDSETYPEFTEATGIGTRNDFEL